MTKDRDSFDKTLRHMAENLNGAYEAVHPVGHPRAGKRCTCSGTAIIACCYINGLGKVLWKGQEPKQRKGSPFVRRDFLRFQKFLQVCMSDFLSQSVAMTLAPLPDGSTSGDEWLYQVYRCGFVHGLPKTGFRWGWNRYSNKYWFKKNGQHGLNIDELVRGFHRGVATFRLEAVKDPDLRRKFMDYLMAK